MNEIVTIPQYKRGVGEGRGGEGGEGKGERANVSSQKKG